MDKRKEKQELFSSVSVPRAVSAMVLPAIVSQIIHVVYNLADTWFVGLTGDPNTVAAISLCLPVYNILTGLSNLFGVGGASVIARFLGSKNADRARRSFAVAAWGAGIAALLYALILAFSAKPLLLRIGADAGSIDFAYVYTLVTVILGGVPTVLAAALSNLIRATGESKKAAVGMTLGAVLNIGLDPLFMFVLLPRGNEVLGAAIATALANVVSLIYFLLYFARNQDGIFSFAPRLLRHGGRILRDVLSCGLAGFTMVAMAMLSNCFLNAMIAELGASAAVAGLGIVRKIDSLAYAVNQGITQGMLPLVAYCYASGKRERMKAIIGFSTACTVIFSLICSTFSYLLAPELVEIFIRDGETVQYGASFLRVLCLAIPIYSVTFVIIAVFQAVGKSIEPFVLSVLHKGSVDILLLFLFRRLFGLENILWATPVMESIALLVALLLLFKLLRNREKQTIREVLQ